MHIYILLMHITLLSYFSKSIMAHSLNQEDDIFYISTNKGVVFQINNSIHPIA